MNYARFGLLQFYPTYYKSPKITANSHKLNGEHNGIIKYETSIKS